MQNIGERLEEARKRKGISVREAAEATKLRSDFIRYFENNQFNFDLPEVYKRGFLKIYTRFLNLDPTSILTDYNAFQIKSDTSSGENQGSFGHMSLSQTEVAGPKKNEETSSEKTTETPTYLIDKSLYIKIGLIIAGLVIAILVIITLIKFLSSDTALDTESSTVKTPTAPSATRPSIPQSDPRIFLIAKEDVRVVVRRKADQQNIFNETIQKGQRISIPKKDGQILQISYSDGNRLIIQRDGKQIISGVGGPGWIELK